MGFYHYGGAGIYLVNLLADDLPGAGGASESVEGRAGTYPKRPGGVDGEDTVAEPFSSPADLGLCNGKVHDRPGVVVLPVLAA